MNTRVTSTRDQMSARSNKYKWAQHRNDFLNTKEK